MKYYKWALNNIRPVRGRFLLGLILIIIEMTSNLSIISLQKKIVDDIFIGQRYDQATFIISCFIIAILLSIILYTVAPMVLHHAGILIKIHLANNILRNLYRLRHSTFSKTSTGKYVSYLSEDVNVIGDSLSYKIPLGIQQLISALIIICILFKINPIIITVILILSLCYIFLGKYFTEKLKKANFAVKEQKSGLLTVIENGLSGTRELLAYNKLDWFRDRYFEQFNKYFHYVLKEAREQNKNVIIIEPLTWSANIFVLIFGAYLVLNNRMTIGEYVISYQFTAKLIDSLQSFYQSAIDLSGLFASIDRVNPISQDVLTKPNKDSQVLLKGRGNINFLDVDIKYEEKYVLNKINMMIPLGKKIAIIGPSGSGKSSIVNLLTKTLEPTNGDIMLDKHSLKKVSEKEWLSNIAIVSQDPFFMKDTILNNLLLGNESINHSDLVDACKTAEIYDFIICLPNKFDSVLGERGSNISGGQKQRLSLARAIMRNPEILILDESTSALDFETERKVINNIDRTRKNQTNIVVAHRLSTIQNADLIFVVEEGRITQSGTPKELSVIEGPYKRLLEKDLISLR